MTLLSIQPTADGGGSETALITMIRQLTSAGWTCHVAIPARPRLADEYAAAGARLHVVPMRRLTTSAGRAYWFGYALQWPLSVARLIGLILQCRPVVVHSNSLHSWYGWAAALLTRRPHVWHAREIVTQSGAALRVEKVLTRRFATEVIAISEAVAVQLAPTRCEVVTDEPDPAVWSPDRAGHTRAELGISDDALVLGSVARIDTWKGFDVLLDAVPLIRAECPDVVVVVAGDAVEGKEAYFEGLEARAADLGVQWLGRRADLPDLMPDFDVFAQVSTTPEPWGLVVTEALASGVPVVAGDAGGPIEILATATPGAGALVPPGDPTALAAAAIALLRSAPRGVEARRHRPPLRQATPTVSFEAVFATAAER